MRNAHAILRTSLVTGLCLLLAGCGAGLIGIAANQNNDPTEAPPPELTLSPLLPLVPVDNTTRTVVVTNAQIPASAQLRVQIEAAGVVVDQGNPTVSGQGGSTVVAFTLATSPIVAQVGDPTAADVDGLFRVLVDGNPVAAAVPIVLARQPRAVLDLAPGVTELFLAPAGQLVRMRVVGLLSTEAANVQMFVTTRDPTQAVPFGGPQPTITRLCTGLTLSASTTPGEVIVTASAPGNSFPDGVRLFLSDAVAGQSTVATNAYYQPDIALALPRQGPTTGGNLVTLIGTALVPYDFTVVPGPAPLAFGDVELSFRKGGRLTLLPREDFRTEVSDGTRLVFRMPASPDGRPGQVDIVLRVRLGSVDAVIVSSQVFLFANPHPFFGPRGAVLDTVPVAVAPIPLDGAPGGDDAPDFAVLTQEGGVGFLQLLLAQENGMFQRFGARRQIGDHEVPAERTPRDLCTGDFDGDLVPDMFIANEGAGATATHHLVMGQAKPEAPLGFLYRIPSEPGTWRCRAANFDADAFSDLLLVPGDNAPVGLLPQVRLARPLEPDRFTASMFVPVRDIPYEATEVADLDGDGFQDVAVVSGSTLQMDVAFGRGDGTFDPAVQVNFTVPGYTPTADAKAIGLHACRDGTLQSLALVLSGSDVVGVVREPLIAVLHQTALRTFAPLVQADVQVIPGVPLSVSLAADLDQANTLEIAIGVRDVATISSLALLRYVAPGFAFIPGGIEIGSEQPRKFTAMHFGRAFPATSLTPEAKAVFVVHESEIDGVTERRLSTRLLFADSTSLTLLPPDAGAVWGSVVDGIVGGDFHPVSIANEGKVRDLALARSGAVDLLENDGFGGFPLPSTHLDAPGLLPRTLQLVPVAAGPTVDSLVFVDSSSRVGIWKHNDPLTAPIQSPTHLGVELRLASTSPLLQTTNLSDATRVRVVDVDGDGTLDLVVLLSFALPALGEGQAQIALLRGKPNPAPNEFPFAQPTVLTPVHGKATSIALGDFAAAGPGLQKRLELAVSVPEGTTPGAIDGDHVRFFRYVAGATPDQDRFEPSADPNGPQVLLAGSMPTQLEAADFDIDGLVDLLVAAAGDDTLRLFRNIAPPSGAQGHVEIDQFFESLTSPIALAPGTPRALRLGDVNGDGITDAIATVESINAGSGQRSTSVAFYLESEPGVFEGAVFVSPQRVGNRNGSMAIDLGDWNRDGVLDLFLGWNTVGAGDRNVRVLFGGSR